MPALKRPISKRDVPQRKEWTGRVTSLKPAGNVTLNYEPFHPKALGEGIVLTGASSWWTMAEKETIFMHLKWRSWKPQFSPFGIFYSFPFTQKFNIQFAHVQATSHLIWEKLLCALIPQLFLISTPCLVSRISDDRDCFQFSDAVRNCVWFSFCTLIGAFANSLWNEIKIIYAFADHWEQRE